MLAATTYQTDRLLNTAIQPPFSCDRIMHEFRLWTPRQCPDLYVHSSLKIVMLKQISQVFKPHYNGCTGSQKMGDGRERLPGQSLFSAPQYGFELLDLILPPSLLSPLALSVQVALPTLLQHWSFYRQDLMRSTVIALPYSVILWAESYQICFHILLHITLSECCKSIN